jgi:hypothetical protein
MMLLLQVLVLVLGVLPTLHAFESSAMRARSSFQELDKLMGRQIRVCASVPDGPDICARSCGAGYIQCASDRLDCYNPGLGHVCCSNGSMYLSPREWWIVLNTALLDYCTAGNVCVDGGSGCCPVGTALSACGAKSTLATLAPPAASSNVVASSTTSIAVVQTSYANTTFTKTSSQSVPVATSEVTPVATAYSTTTIPLPNGGVTTSTAFTLVYPTPTSTSTSGPGAVIINNSGARFAVPEVVYGMGWLAIAMALGAML